MRFQMGLSLNSKKRRWIICSERTSCPLWHSTTA